MNTFIRSRLDWNKIATDEGKTWLRYTRHLLTLRHRYIVPLLHPGGAVEGHVLKTAPGMVAVSWRFPSGTLSGAEYWNEACRPACARGETRFARRRSTTFYPERYCRSLC